MRFKHTNRPGFWFGLIDFCTAGLFFLFYMPLILLHGNGENCDYFKGQVDEFARSWHVFALDTRGHGKTSRGTAPFTIRQFADDLLAFMDAQGIGKAHVLGFFAISPGRASR